MSRYSLVIDQEACWGCRACEVACKQENERPYGLRLIQVLDEAPPGVGAGEGYYVSVCRHCEDPECVSVCPEEAIIQRQDGIVLVDHDKCTGCGFCIEECPYDALVLDHQRGVADKCNMCLHRVDRGLIPACADNVCLAHCIYFGDPEEIRIRIAEKKRKRTSDSPFSQAK